MKKFVYVLSDILIIGFLAGGYLMQHFTRKKLGMRRWLNYNERKLLDSIPMDTLKYVVTIIIIAVALMLALIYFRKAKSYSRVVCMMIIALIALSAFCLGFTLTQSRETVRAYYFVLPMIVLACFVQIIKAAVALVLCKKDEI